MYDTTSYKTIGGCDMLYVIGLIVAGLGVLVGGISGGLLGGYLVIFKSLAHIASITDISQWTKVLEGGIILLFTKTIIIACALLGAFIGGIPGFLIIAKADED